MGRSETGSRSRGWIFLTRGEQGLELTQGTPVDVALEEYDLARRPPIVDPAPVIELRMRCCGEIDARFPGNQAQQEPALLLADAHGAGASADESCRKAIIQPIPGFSDHFYVLGLQPRLFGEFAVQGIFRALIALNPALRELPSILAAAAGPEHAARTIDQDDTHIGPVPLRINHLRPRV